MSDTDTYDGIEPIAIIGMSGRFPDADNIDEFWQNLCNGLESAKTFSDEELKASGISSELFGNPRYVKANPILQNIEMFDASFFGFSPKEAAITDPQHRLFLECAYEALENAGYNSDIYPGRIGVYAGCGMNTYLLKNILFNQEVIQNSDQYQLAIGNDKDFIPTRVCYKLNLRGAGINIGTACSTSLVAVHLACQSLLNYQCDMILAGGASIRVPQKSGYFYQDGGILSPDGHCRAFDANAKGTLPSSGVGVVLLKRLEDAINDKDHIYAIIRGSAVNNDGSLKVGYTAPSIEGQSEVIAEAHAVSGVSPETISYVEAHGTGTTLGDPIEIAALTQAFRAGTRKKGFCAIGALKANIGHLDSAAGVAGLIKTVLSLKNRMIPPSINFESPNPKIDFANSPFYVNTELSEWKTDNIPLRAGVSAFGIGGTNAHVILESVQSAKCKVKSAKPFHLLTLSAKTESALDAATANLAKHLNDHPDVDLADAAYTLHVGRKAFQHRRIVICKDIEDAETLLKTPDPKRVFTGVDDSKAPKIVFMFTGQGAQYVNMGRDLYQTEPVFREAIDKCSKILMPLLKFDLRGILYPETESENPDLLNQTNVTQPALFVFEYALAQLWFSWGIKPDAMIGHSIGEYVAACLAEVFSLEDALTLVAARGQMMQQLPRGAMLGIPLSEKEVLSLIADTKLSLAAVNSSSLCVVSGQTDAIEAFERQMAEKKIECRRLHTSHAFHSEMFEPMLKPFAERVGKTKRNSPKIPYISNVTGKLITSQQALDPTYWAAHLRQTVRFADGIVHLMSDDSKKFFLELGSGRTLSTFALAHPNKAKRHIVLNSIRHPKENISDTAYILAALGRLWLNGAKPDWNEFHAHEDCHRVPLPTYPFERKRYWIEPQSHQISGFQAALAKKSDIAEWFYVPSWKRSVLSGLQTSASTWLIFMDDCGVGDQLAKRLTKNGHEVIKVFAGSKFAHPCPSQEGKELQENEYSVNPQIAEDYDALIAELKSLGKIPKNIVHLWSVTKFCTLHFALCTAPLHSLLFLVQALGKNNITDKIKLAVISNHIQDVIGNEQLNPEKAAILGPVKIIPLEYPNITACSIDVIAEDKNLAEVLITELMGELKDVVVAYRGHHRWIQIFEPIRLEKISDKPSRLREKGVYLITGGLGGIGFVLAEHLAKMVKARLILTARSAFPKPESWEEWLNTHDEKDPISIRIRKLREMTELGAEVLILNADVADFDQMEAGIHQAEQRFGKINGLIHAAGLADYAGIIQRRSKEMTEKVLAPKIAGTLVLDKILKDMKLDFFVLCSSLSNILYRKNFGQAAYNAANEFLDAFASYKTLQGTFTVSVNWDIWQEVGMSLETAKQLTGNHAGLSEYAKDILKNGILPSEGIEAFNRIISSKLTRIAVSTQDMNRLLQKDTISSDKASDKINALKNSYKNPKANNSYAAPENDTERLLAVIWQELLGVEQIGIHDNFFELGGHSLLAVQLISRLHETFQTELSIQTIFNHPTVAELAKSIENARRPVGGDFEKIAGLSLPIIPINRIDNHEFPLSFAQERLWFLAQLEPDNPAYNLLSVLTISGMLDVSVLEKSINSIVARHEVMRTAFRIKNDGSPVQVIANTMTISLSVIDLQNKSETEQSAATERLASEQAKLPFDLAKGPLLRINLLRLKPEKHVLLLAMHHIVSDAWSGGIFNRELAAFYTEKDTKILLPELPVQYADFSLWQRKWFNGEISEQQIKYWKKQIENAPQVLQLPSDRIRPSKPTSDGAAKHFEIDSDLTKKLSLLSRQSEATLFMTIFAAFAILLFRYTGQDDMLIGTPVANRNRKEIEPLLGFFVNTLVLRADLSDDPGFSELIKRIRQVTSDALAHQDMPFEKLVEALQPERNLSRTPLFQVMFNYMTGEKLELPGLAISLSERKTISSQFDLTLEFTETDSGLKGIIEYSTDLFDQDRICRMSEHFKTLLAGIADNPERRISELPLLTSSEQDQLLIGFNNTDAVYPCDKIVIDLFEEQVKNHPDNIAVVFQDTQLTYRELNEASNRLAHFLKDKYRIQPDECIGLLLERSEQMIVGILGILKSGGAYVPIDPEYPSERIRHIISDSSCRLVVSENGIMKTIDSDAETVDIRNIHHKNSANPVRSASPDNLAYVIYTSGSTGRPKGVAIEHRNLYDYVMTFINESGVGPDDRVLQQTTVTFDASVEELYSALCTSAKLVICHEPKDLELLFSDVIRYNITLMSVSPLVANYLNTRADELFARNPHLRLMVIGGDVLYPSFIDMLYKKITVYNSYGPTEATVCSTYYRVERLSEFLPIGKPIANRRIYILDSDLNPVPAGVPGEMCISGAGVARGYLNSDELTKEKFIPNPFRHGERLYKTGDSARWLPDGNIEFLGRNDDQVKIRGYRIELGEIENRLMSHESVAEAVVIARDIDKNHKELTAYVRSNADLNVNLLRDHLKKTLPDYMIPSYFIRLDKFPLTPNGKINKKILPEPSYGEIIRGSEYLAPRNETEKKLADIWEEILGVGKIGIRDNFFDSGGHSLKVIQMVSMIHEDLGVEIPVREIFINYTIESLAEKISAKCKVQSAESFTPLVCIRQGGEKHPFFCVHPSDGNVFCYNSLSRELGKNQPFYALQAFGLDSDTAPLTRIEDMAEKYIQAIFAVYSGEHYILAGFSNGGVITYEMAQRLRQYGKQVDLLVLIDSFLPGMFSFKDEIEAFMEFGYALGSTFDIDILSFYCKIRKIDPEHGADGIRKDLEILTYEARLHTLQKCLQNAGILKSELSVEYLNRVFKVFIANLQAVDSYKVQPYSGSTVLFRAAGDPALRKEYPRDFHNIGNLTNDPTLGWGKYVAAIEAHDIPDSYHHTILTQPHVGIIAEKLRRLS